MHEKKKMFSYNSKIKKKNKTLLQTKKKKKKCCSNQAFYACSSRKKKPFVDITKHGWINLANNFVRVTKPSFFQWRIKISVYFLQRISAWNQSYLNRKESTNFQKCRALSKEYGGGQTVKTA